MLQNFETFYFEDFSFAPETGALSLQYSLDEDLQFEEVWNFPISHQIPNTELQKAFQGLWLMCGISYYKAYLSKNIVIKNHKLSEEQARFFEKIYLHGLGEFFYENKIDPNGLINFPFDEVSKRASEPSRLELSGTLIPVGGGKDSLTTIELLKESEEDLTTWAVGHGELFGPMLEKIDLLHLQVQRKICPNLIAENAKGVLNGHVPISAILAFASVVTALLHGKKYIALSNESSANEANVKMYGMAINHQYSKTLEFEQDFQAYVSDNISDQVHYFSFLRPLKEIQIAQIFCSMCFEKYKIDFSSCNRNFTIATQNRSMSWCGKCSKCAFVACIFAPYLDRTQMKELFGCEVFQQPEILGFIPELLGQTEHKPFECVGEYAEVEYAINQAVATGNWSELQLFANDDTSLKLDLAPHAMPEAYESILKQSLEEFPLNECRK